MSARFTPARTLGMPVALNRSPEAIDAASTESHEIARCVGTARNAFVPAFSEKH
jgi:hypothetical protein